MMKGIYLYPAYILLLKIFQNFIKKEKEVIIVSSGSVALGMKKLCPVKTASNTTVDKQAAASIGQPFLMKIWQEGFENTVLPSLRCCLPKMIFQTGKDI